MPVTCQIDQAQGIIRTRCIGNVSLDEVIDHFEVLERDPKCPNHLDVLLDLSGTTSLAKADQLKAVSREIGRIRKRVRFDACAIVASRDALFGMARMFEVLAEDGFHATRVFRALDEAEQWLESQHRSSAETERQSGCTGLTGP